jgi:RNA polymerase sigma-70 factor (ECF subfamily)
MADTEVMTARGDDGARLARVQAGDPDAFADMFDAHVQAVHRYCARRSEDVEAAEDLTSVVFLEAWRIRAQAVLVEGSLRPWLLAIARNVARNANRSRRRYRAALVRLHALPVPDMEDHADAVAAQVDAPGARETVAAALAQLSDKQREVAELCLVERLSPGAAARVLGVPEGTVKSRLADARVRLRLLLRPSEFDPVTDPAASGGHSLGERHSGARAGRTPSSWPR